MKESLGITVKKEDDFSEWYTQVILKSDLCDYSPVSGCIIFKPYSYAIWEKIKEQVDKRIKAMGVKNAYFPLFIPEKLLKKEAENFAGFSPEVAWVSESGSSKMDMPELVTFNIPENAPVCTIPYNIEIENSQGRYASGSIRLTVKAR